MKKWLKKIICKVKGHDYPCSTFTTYTLSCCRRCGKEILDRTFDDILPSPDEIEWSEQDD